MARELHGALEGMPEWFFGSETVERVELHGEGRGGGHGLRGSSNSVLGGRKVARRDGGESWGVHKLGGARNWKERRWGRRISLDSGSSPRLSRAAGRLVNSGRGSGEATAGERRRVAHATNGRAARRWDGAGLSATYGDGD